MTLIYFLIVIGILVFVHEFGHFIMAKRAGVRVEKFSLGMGPKIFGFKKGDTEYVLSALPLGGYVKMAGENPTKSPPARPTNSSPRPCGSAQRSRQPARSRTSCLPSWSCRWCSWSAPIRWARPGWDMWRKTRLQSRQVSRWAILLNGPMGEPWWTGKRPKWAVNPDTDIAIVIERNGERKTLTLRPKLDPERKIGVSGLILTFLPRSAV